MIDSDKNGLLENTLTDLVIWTTTPWSLPSNAAVAVNANGSYALYRNVTGTHQFILGRHCKDTLHSVFSDKNLRLVKEFKGSELIGLHYAHPMEGLPCLVIGADFVDSLSASGLVHLAPSHGFDDFDALHKFINHENNLKSKAKEEILFLKKALETCNVNEDGNYQFDSASHPVSAASPLQGLNVLQNSTSDAILKLLGESVLGIDHNYIHKYPYDWRSKKPIIIRLTRQWFASIDKIRDKLLDQIQRNIDFIPSSGANRIQSMIKARNDWCISRQRSWGVPIPILYTRESSNQSEHTVLSHKHLMSDEIINEIRNAFVNENGSDCWWNEAGGVQSLIKKLEDSMQTPVYKESSTMDVWFDSGTSWTLLSSGTVADLLVEGSDQHRGWFQSSLITSGKAR